MAESKTIYNQPWIRNIIKEEDVLSKSTGDKIGVREIITGKCLVQEQITITVNNNITHNYSNNITLISDIWEVLKGDPISEINSPAVIDKADEDGNNNFYIISPKENFFYWKCKVTDISGDSVIDIKIECPRPSPEDFVCMGIFKSLEKFYTELSKKTEEINATYATTKQENYLHYWLNYYNNTLNRGSKVYNIQKTTMNVPEITHIDCSTENLGPVVEDKISYNLPQDDFLNNLMSMF